ncbi:MAG: hypothetical protein J0H74_12825 [Chitinophagaceae bacterium]|nr:hypothetical protein [Chitinophagaceae bacterium]
MNQFIETFVHPSKGLFFTDHGGYESRNESTMALFREAFDQVRDTSRVRAAHFYINTGDVSSKINNTLTFGYTMADDVVPCPDFIFDRYVECGIGIYEEAVSSILDKGERKHSVDKLFWTGNLNTQPLRHRLYKLGCQYKDRMEIIPMDWKREAPKGSRHNYTSYVSPDDQTRYKYLIDCGAGGYSGRVKLLLHSNRPLFLVDRPRNMQEFFHRHLVPFEHYIPVKWDLSDLIAQLDWAEENYDQAVIIARNARKFAMDHLNKRNVINYLSTALQLPE